MVSVTLETAELSETALESLEDRTGPAQTAYAPQEHSSAASTRSVTAGGLHSSGIEEPKLSGPDHRRRLRRAKWQQCAVAGAAVGVSSLLAWVAAASFCVHPLHQWPLSPLNFCNNTLI